MFTGYLAEVVLVANGDYQVVINRRSDGGLIAEKGPFSLDTALGYVMGCYDHAPTDLGPVAASMIERNIGDGTWRRK